MRNFIKGFAFVAFFLATLPTLGSAATVIVNADEWTMSNAGYSSAGIGNTDQFVQNIVSEFGTTLHAYSNNFGFTQSQIATSMTNAGATYTTGLGITFDLPTLSSYSGIFLGGNYLTSAEKTVLSNYVSGGGNVYIAAGTGNGGAVAEANAWNDFLAPYDIQLIGNYVGPNGNIPVSGDQIFNGVSQLYFAGSNDMQLTGPVVCCASNPKIAVARMSPVPLPASGLLLALTLLGGGIVLRRRTG